MTILIYGGKGFIGKHILKVLYKYNKKYILSNKRIYNYNDILEDIDIYKPKFIISSAGFSTPNNIDFYENNKSDLMLTNTVGNLILAYLCNKMNIHLTIIMSGCIYNYHKYFDHPFTELDIPNFNGNYYSSNRIQTEKILSIYNNLCILRLRMPISSDLNPKSLITKIINYRNVINIPNSMSVLDDVMPFINIVLNFKLTGTFNLVNNGLISHPQILNLYIKYVNPMYKYNIITEEEQNKKLLAKRSNCWLDNDKLLMYYNPGNITESVEKVCKDLSKIINKYHLF